MHKKPNIEIVILGSGTRVLLPDRSMSGYAIRAADCLVLLDCGDGVIRRGLEAGLPMIEIDAILFTHLHLDHIADLPPLLWALHGEGQIRAHRPLHLYGPGGLRSFFNGLSGLYGEWIEKLPPPVVVREVNRECFSVGPWTVETLPMNHGLPANGYRLSSPERIIAYTGDTGLSEEVVALAEDADLLIIECSFPNGQGIAGHLTAGEAGRIAAQANCRRVLLTHLYPESLAADVVAQCREHFRGPIELSHDLKRLSM